MKLLEYKILTELESRNEIEKAKFLCYYLVKERGIVNFSSKNISEIFIDAGFSKPNFSRLKSNLLKSNNMKANLNSQFEFNTVTLEHLEKELGKYWDNYDEIITYSEVLDEKKFTNKYNFITNLIKQINATYAAHCYDATAIIMRRLFEISMIVLYRNTGIDDEIKNADGTYFNLDLIIKNAVSNKKLSLSRIKTKYSHIQTLGNYAAHRIEFICSKKDIDDVTLDYRTALEEIFIKARISS